MSEDGGVCYQIVVAVVAGKGGVASSRGCAGVTDQVPVGLGEQGGRKHTCRPQQSPPLVRTELGLRPSGSGVWRVSEGDG
jgi:hypothetical protein